MLDYHTGSRDYLKRAKLHRTNGEIASLLYAALEIRCGIEARLHEYIEGAAKFATIKKGHWQIKHLVREVERAFDNYTKAVEVIFCHPETNEEIRVEYTPIPHRLKKIGEMLGDFLHHKPSHKLTSEDFVRKLTLLVDEGIDGLAFSTRGILLGPPQGSGPANTQIRLIFENGRMPSFLKNGVQAKFKMRLVRKDEKGLHFKPI